MKYLRLLLTALFPLGLITGAAAAGTPPEETLLLGAGWLILACLLGEYLLPFLTHLSDQLFDLDRRVEDALPGLDVPAGARLPNRLRIYVMDDDLPVITWVGFRTVMVGRGCYNLQAGEFHCALQEALEQRLNLRSFAVLLATVGNPVFFHCRLFCRFGQFIFRGLGVLIGAIVGYRRMYEGGRVGYVIGDGLYRFFSALFLLICNVSVYIPYAVTLFWADLESDRRLCAMGLKGGLEKLLDEARHTRYTGRFMRERALIMRPPVEWRLRRVAATPAPGLHPAAGYCIRPEPWNMANPRRPVGRPAIQNPRSGLVVPEPLRNPHRPAPAADLDQDYPRIRILNSSKQRGQH